MRPSLWNRWNVSAAALLILGLTGVLTSAGKGYQDWFLLFSTVGTALGTLLLAWYTYRLALSTRESVAGSDRLIDLSNSQLEEVRSQRDLVVERSQKIEIQAEATRRLADASEISATEAAKERIDAISPLILMELTLGRVVVRESDGSTHPLTPDDQWYEPQLRGRNVSVELTLSLRNLGRSPARIDFNYTTQNLQPSSSSAHPGITLKPDESFEDSLAVWIPATEATNGRLVEVSVTYNGIIHGEMFDHVQWNGWITPLKLDDGVARLNDARWIINAGGASVVRSYPNLERPDELAAARERLLDPRG